MSAGQGPGQGPGQGARLTRLITAPALTLDLLTGALATLNPAAAQELLYPALTLSGGLIGIEQLGWLSLTRAALALPAQSRGAWHWLWVSWAPMEVWSAAHLGHLGPWVVSWHAARALIGVGLWWAAGGVRGVRAVSGGRERPAP